MTEKRKSPALRFRGYTDDWEQRKLGEILQERNTRTSDFESNPLYSLTIESGVTPKTDRYERSSLVTKTEDLFKIVKPNEFVTNPMNLRFGALGYNKNAFTVSVSGYYDVFSIDDDKCSGFWNSYFKTPTAMNIFDNAATGSLIEKRRVKYSTLQQLAFYMPNDLSEKAEIGKYMNIFDTLITLHQRKLEKLKLVKKSMLEKMFPKNGSSVPEIRFNGFTDDWEQRKLGEVGSVSMCRRIFKEQTSESGDIPFYKIGTFGGEADAFISRELFEEYKAKYPYPEKGDILISASGSIGRTVEFTGQNEYFQDSNIVWLNHDERLDNSFLKCFYSVVKWAGIEGSTIKRLYNDNILNTAITLPSVAEQKKIGAYFSNLDSLITLHQCKVEKLQIMKKSMLEKMFV